VIELQKNNPSSTVAQEFSDDAWSLYIYAMKSPMTRQKYIGRLNKFFDFLELEGVTPEEKSKYFILKSKENGAQWIFCSILKYMQYQLERVHKREITGSTLNNYLKSIKLFCEMADISISWKKISRGLPRGRNYADDRIPTDDEIQKLLEYPDRRIKAIVYTMTSSGIRLGSWDYLKWGHVKPIERDGKIVAAKVIVYAGEDEEYFTFITREAMLSLKDWMKYREDSGESISEDSWLMRDLWDTGAVRGGPGLVSKPKKLASLGIKRLIERALWAQGLRKRLKNGRKRHPYQAVHSFRKWFKTRAENGGMKPINVEILLSHTVGISSSYYRPTETDLLNDYLKIVDLLIFDKREKLNQELQIYQQKSQEDIYHIKGKLQEKEDAIKSLSEQFSSLKLVVDQLINGLSSTKDQDQVDSVIRSLFSSGLIQERAI
jgi:integrase